MTLRKSYCLRIALQTLTANKMRTHLHRTSPLSRLQTLNPMLGYSVAARRYSEEVRSPQVSCTCQPSRRPVLLLWGCRCRVHLAILLRQLVHLLLQELL